MAENLALCVNLAIIHLRKPLRLRRLCGAVSRSRGYWRGHASWQPSKREPSAHFRLVDHQHIAFLVLSAPFADFRWVDLKKYRGFRFSLRTRDPLRTFDGSTPRHSRRFMFFISREREGEGKRQKDKITITVSLMFLESLRSAPGLGYGSSVGAGAGLLVSLLQTDLKS